MVKNIVILSIIASQLIWNVSDSLVRESWTTEEQTEQDFSKEECSGKEKEAELHSFFLEYLRGTSRVYIPFNAECFLSKNTYVPPFKPISTVATKIPLYLIQSCIRI